MGITRPIEKYERGIFDSLGWGYKGLKWCEFGNLGSYKKMAAKKIYESYGVHHVSMDLNGRDGALPIDLGQPMSAVYINQFNVMTNYGTIEHINNQYQAFKNMHDMCKENGIMIHIFPLVGNWLRHARYYYSEEFAKELAKLCNYHVIKLTVLDKSVYEASKNVIAVTYMKKEINKFVTEEEFSRIEGLTDSGDRSKTGNYTRRKK